MVGVAKESGETMASSESGIAVRDYAKASPFDQS
jgi:predicted RNA-binding protein